MRNPLNKAMKPQEKALAEEQRPVNDQIMNPDLQMILDMVNGIQKEPGIRERYLSGIAQAKEVEAQAAEAKETAQDEAEFDKACEDAIRAREKEQFFQRMLEKLDYTPRMDEERYSEAVRTVSAVMQGAAENFKETAKKVMAELVRARADFIQTMKDADKVLIALDMNSNVLQAKYRFRKVEYTDGSSTLTEDPNEWMRHIVRYGQGKAVDLIYKAAERKSNHPAWEEARDEIACAAWLAAERVSK